MSSSRSRLTFFTLVHASSYLQHFQLDLILHQTVHFKCDLSVSLPLPGITEQCKEDMHSKGLEVVKELWKIWKYLP